MSCDLFTYDIRNDPLSLSFMLIAKMAVGTALILPSTQGPHDEPTF